MFPKVPLRSVLRKVEEPVVIQPEKTYKQVTVRLFHKGVVLRGQQAGADIRTAGQWGIRGGQILLSRIDARNGAIGLVPFDLDGAVVTNDFWAFEVDSRAAEPGFLDAYFGTPEFVEACGRASEGTTNRVRLQLERFLDIVVPLPSLTEQRRIVTRIEELAAKIDEARGLRLQTAMEAEALAKSQLAATVDTLVKRVGSRPLGQLIMEAGYGTSAKCNYERPKGAVPVLRIPNVASERVNSDAMKYGTLSSAELQRVVVSEGDVLVVRTNGSADLVGRCAVVPRLPEPTAFASYLIRLRCDPKTISPHYLQLMLKHLRTGGELIDFARTTAGQYNVSLGRLGGAPLPVPPLAEQRGIVARMDELQERVDTLKRLQIESAAELDALLPSILDKAFKGEL